MSKDVIRGALSVALIAMGLAGLFLHIDYSGWVLFFGLMAIP
jgi:hypothetical protein